MTPLDDRDKYIFLRTLSPIDRSQNEMNALIEALGETTMVDFLGFGEELTWENGLVLKVYSRKTVGEFSTYLRSALSKFDGWAMFDATDEFLESLNGPLSWFYQKSRSRKRISLCKIFLLTSSNEMLDKIRDAIKDDCVPVFHFNDGRILFVNSREPVTITTARCQKLLKNVDAWCIIDSFGNCSHSGENDPWCASSAGDLDFGNGEGDDAWAAIANPKKSQ